MIYEGSLLNKLENVYELFEKWNTYFAINYLNYLHFHKALLHKPISKGLFHNIILK